MKQMGWSEQAQCTKSRQKTRNSANIQNSLTLPKGAGVRLYQINTETKAFMPTSTLKFPGSDELHYTSMSSNTNDRPDLPLSRRMETSLSTIRKLPRWAK